MRLIWAERRERANDDTLVRVSGPRAAICTIFAQRYDSHATCLPSTLEPSAERQSRGMLRIARAVRVER